MKRLLIYLAIIATILVSVNSILAAGSLWVTTYQAIGTTADIAVLFTAPLAVMFSLIPIGGFFVVKYLVVKLKSLKR